MFIQVRLEKQIEPALEVFEKAMLDRPEVMECYLMTGDADYLLRVVVSDMQALERFIVNFLSRVPGVGNIQSSFSLKQVKYQTALPLPIDPARAATSASHPGPGRAGDEAALSIRRAARRSLGGARRLLCLRRIALRMAHGPTTTTRSSSAACCRSATAAGASAWACASRSRCTATRA